MSTPQITWARGYGAYDATPDNRSADTFGEFLDAVLADRGTRKGQQWIAAECGIAPDDELHRTGGTNGSFARAIGKPHRCRACALPRAWFGGDVDKDAQGQTLTPEAFHALVAVLHRYRGAVYTTASSTPEAPRCRIVLELDAAVGRDDLVLVSQELRRRIDADMAQAGHGPVPWDAACDKPEQPLYLPTKAADVYRLDGEAVMVGEVLGAALAAAKPQPSPAPGATGPDVVVEVERHADVLRLTGRMANEVQRGMSMDAALAALCAEAQRGRWTREVPVAELRQALEGAVAKLRSGEWSAPKDAAQDAASEPESTGPALVDVPLGDMMHGALEPPQFVVGPVVPRGLVTLLGGHGGAGKSMFSLILAAHVAAGRSAFGWQMQRGRVLYVSLEDPGSVVRYRLRKIVTAYGLDPAAVATGMRVVDGTDADAALVTEVNEYGAKRIVSTPTMVEVEAAAKGVDLVVVDNASDAFDGNENERRAVRQFIRRLAGIAKANNAGLLLLIHINKASATANGATDGNSYSGSTAWHNSARSRLAMVPRGEAVVEVLHEKNQHGKPADPVLLGWSTDGVLEFCSREIVNRSQTDQAQADAEAVLEAIGAAVAADLIIPAARSGPRTAWHALAELPELPEVLRAKRPGKHRVDQALTGLLRSGAIVQEVFKTANRKEGTRLTLAQPDAPEVRQ